ncbi:MAG: ribosomal protein L7/L12 [Pseudomonadaceae bacterium]
MKQDLDVQVVSALQNGRKVEAIKLLRKQRGIGLKEAKDIVDRYCEEHGLSSSSQASGGTGGLMLVGLLVVVGYLVYRYVLGSAAG